MLNKEQPHVLVGKAVEAAAGLFLFCRDRGCRLVAKLAADRTLRSQRSARAGDADRAGRSAVSRFSFSICTADISDAGGDHPPDRSGLLASHVICCIIAGLATVLAWRIIVGPVWRDLPQPRLTAFFLSLPAGVAGCILHFSASVLRP